MSGDNVTVAPSSIAASQSDLTKFILDSEPQIREAYLAMCGYHMAYDANKNEWGYEFNKESAYPKPAILFMNKKLREIMSKNQFLSRYNTESEMNREAKHMALSFMAELALNLKAIEISEPAKIDSMRNLYSNLLAQAVRHALFESDKEFLGKTTSESTSKVQQVITEQQNKGGLFGGLLGRKE